MAAAKMETAAERYRRIRAEKEKTETVHDIPCGDCGMVWGGRRVGIDFWVSSGILPLHLVETMVKATQTGGDPEIALKSMATHEIIQSIEFSSKVVKFTAVSPKIVETVQDADQEISYEEVLTCCYKKLLNWQMQGGAEAAGLSTFPQE